MIFLFGNYKYISDIRVSIVSRALYVMKEHEVEGSRAS